MDEWKKIQDIIYYLQQHKKKTNKKALSKHLDNPMVYGEFDINEGERETEKRGKGE